jgi:hypothetical protein
VGQHLGWEGVQVNRPEHRQGQGQHQHAHRDPDGRADQGAPVVLGHPDPDPEQHDGDDRQPDPQGVEQVEGVAGAGDVGRLNSTKEALTSGIRAARANPEATSCCLTVWMKGARLTLTVSPWTVTVSPPWPVRALTSVWWATRLAWTQASAKAWLWTILPTSVRTKLWMPLASGPANPRSRSASWGRTPWAASASTDWLVRPWTSR